MFKQNLIVLIIACLALPQISALAQEQQSDLYDLPPAQEGDLMCRCISTFLPNQKETYYFKIDDTYHEVALIGEGVSIPFPVRGSTTFTLYSKGVNEEGVEVYIPVVEQALEGVGGNYLIMLSRSNNNAALQAKTYNISRDSYPANSFYLFNESAISLAVQVNKINAMVEPFASHEHHFKDVGRDTYTSAKIAIAYKGEVKVMASKRLRIIPGRRVIMVCFPSRSRAKMGATPLRVITLQDMP